MLTERLSYLQSNQRIVSRTEQGYEFYGPVIATKELILYHILQSKPMNVKRSYPLMKHTYLLHYISQNALCVYPPFSLASRSVEVTHPPPPLLVPCDTESLIQPQDDHDLNFTSLREREDGKREISFQNVSHNIKCLI